ncbi:hypothetical protein AB4Z54_44750, partial [Streptomyces sp. MCAF7]
VLDAVIAIANGGSAGVPKMVETALAASIPLLIGLLASLLGVGGLANKIKQVFQKVSRPVNRAIDKIAAKIAQVAKKFWNKLKGKRGGEKGGDKKNGKLKPETVHFRMHGEPHRLIYRPPGMLIMASDPEKVLSKVTATLEVIENNPVAPDYQKRLLREIAKKAGDIIELKGDGFTQEDLRGELLEFAGLCDAYGGAFDRKDIDPVAERLPELPPLTELSTDRKVLKAQSGQRVTNTVATQIASALGYDKISQRGKASAVIY